MPQVPQVFAEVRQRFALVVLVVPWVLLGGVGGLIYAQMKAPTYTADAYVIVVASQEAGPGTALNYAQAYGRIARNPDVLSWSTAGGGPAVASRWVRASTSPETPLIQIMGSGGTATGAATYANAAADALIRYGNSHQKDTGVRLASMGRASAPDAPSSPNLPVSVAVGAASGLLLGALVAAGARGRRTGTPGYDAPAGPAVTPAPERDASDLATAGRR